MWNRGHLLPIDILCWESEFYYIDKNNKKELQQ